MVIHKDIKCLVYNLQGLRVLVHFAKYFLKKKYHTFSPAGFTTDKSRQRKKFFPHMLSHSKWN